MKVQLSKRTTGSIIGGFGLALMMGLGVSVFIHKLGVIIRYAGDLLGLGENTETFAAIFDQLQTAEVDLPSGLLLALCLLLAFAIGGYFKFVGRKGTEKKLLYTAGIIGGILWILAAVILIGIVTLWLTDVNDIRFGTVIQFLYNALQHGVF